jgi:hypothetical protein
MGYYVCLIKFTIDINWTSIIENGEATTSGKKVLLFAEHTRIRVWNT